MKYSLPTLCIMLFLSLSSCVKKQEPDASLTEKNYNISYGSDAAQKLDLYLPPDRDENTPFAILLHGGAWTYNDKQDMNLLQDSLLKRGIASVSINYRDAGPQLHIEALMDDVDRAVQYCYEHGDAWNIRKDKYIMGGISAGAHMSLLYAYHYDKAGRISGIISAAGPTDFTQTDWLNYAASIGLSDEIENMVGAKYTPGQALSPRFTMASPRAYVKNMPTLILHGTSDNIVPYTQSQLLNSDMANANYTHKLVTLQNAGHDLGVANPEYYKLVLNEIANWCKIYGK